MHVMARMVSKRRTNSPPDLWIGRVQLARQVLQTKPEYARQRMPAQESCSAVWCSADIVRGRIGTGSKHRNCPQSLEYSKGDRYSSNHLRHWNRPPERHDDWDRYDKTSRNDPSAHQLA